MSGGKLITFSIILLINFIIEIIFTFKSNIFIREFILFWIFFIAAIVLLMGVNKRWGAPWFTVFFALQILNFLYLHNNMIIVQYSGWLAVALFVSVIGLLVAVASIKKRVKKVPKPEVVDIEEKPKKTTQKKK